MNQFINPRKMTQIYKALISIALTLSLAFTAQAQITSSSFEISKNLDIFATMYKELNNNYVDELNHGELIKTGIDAILDKLDP